RAGNVGVNVARAVGVADVAAAIAVAGAAGIGVQVGGVISHAIGNDDVQIGNTRCTASYSGWHCDDGADPASRLSTVYSTSWTPSQNFPSKDAACAAAWAAFTGDKAGWTNYVTGNGYCTARSASTEYHP